MIQVTLERDVKVGKNRITGWMFVTKERATEIKVIRGVREIIEEKDLPYDFTKSFRNYCVDNGEVIYAPRI